MGFEPTTNGTTIRYSNQLSYGHQIEGAKIIIRPKPRNTELKKKFNF